MTHKKKKDAKTQSDECNKGRDEKRNSKLILDFQYSKKLVCIIIVQKCQFGSNLDQ